MSLMVLTGVFAFFVKGIKLPLANRTQCFKPSFVQNTADKGLKSYFWKLYEVKLRQMVLKLTLRGITPTLMLISRMASAQGTVMESLYLSSIQIPLSFQYVTLRLCSYIVYNSATVYLGSPPFGSNCKKVLALSFNICI